MAKSSARPTEIRGYAWGNMYISPIQHGIQGWHANNEVLSQYKPTSPEFALFSDWAKNHKTLILLNGGNSLALEYQYKKLCMLNARLKKDSEAQKLVHVKSIPVTCFHEPDLNDALTSVFTVLPNTLYCTPADHQRIKDFFLVSSLSRDNVMSDPNFGYPSEKHCAVWMKELTRFCGSRAEALQLLFKMVASHGRLA